LVEANFTYTRNWLFEKWWNLESSKFRLKRDLGGSGLGQKERRQAEAYADRLIRAMLVCDAINLQDMKKELVA